MAKIRFKKKYTREQLQALADKPLPGYVDDNDPYWLPKILFALCVFGGVFELLSGIRP
jgi:hypothetical protein